MATDEQGAETAHALRPTGRRFLALALAAALALRVAVALAVPPRSDVYYYLTEAARALLSGLNPYDYTYTGIPPALVTPGAAHIFAYLPATILYLTPFYVLGDVRAGMIAADLIVGSCLYLYGGAWRRWTVPVFLFLPFTVLFSTVYLNAGLVAMVFIAIALVLERRGEGALGAVSLGLALASIQFTLLILPLFAVYYARTKRLPNLLIAVLVALGVVLPFLVASPSLFANEAFSFQFSRAPLPILSSGGPVGFVLNPSLGALTSAAFGFVPSIYAKLVVELVLLVPVVRVRDLETLARNSSIFVLVSVFVLPNDFFWAYLEMPFMLVLFWLGSLRVPPPGVRTVPKT